LGKNIQRNGLHEKRNYWPVKTWAKWALKIYMMMSVNCEIFGKSLKIFGSREALK
jgi:hypothetical protein